MLDSNSSIAFQARDFGEERASKVTTKRKKFSPQEDEWIIANRTKYDSWKDIANAFSENFGYLRGESSVRDHWCHHLALGLKGEVKIHDKVPFSCKDDSWMIQWKKNNPAGTWNDMAKDYNNVFSNKRTPSTLNRHWKKFLQEEEKVEVGEKAAV